MEKHINNIYIFIILKISELSNLNEQEAYNEINMALWFRAISIFIALKNDNALGASCNIIFQSAIKNDIALTQVPYLYNIIIIFIIIIIIIFIITIIIIIIIVIIIKIIIIRRKR